MAESQVYDGRIAALFQEIEDVIAQEARLETKKREKFQELNALRSRMPLEVLTDIFFFAVESDGQNLKGHMALPMPLVLGSVCRWWRAIADSQARLWTLIEIQFVKSRQEVQQTLLEEWLARSKNQHLTICLRVKQPLPSDGCTCNARALTWDPPSSAYDALLNEAHRWEHFSIVGDGSFYHLRSKMASHTFQFPVLSTLHLDGDCGEASPHGASPPPTLPWNFLSAPKLRGLNLFRETKVTIHWRKLNDLKATFDLKDAMQALRVAASVIRSCDFTLLDSGTSLSQAVVRLPKLTTLKLDAANIKTLGHPVYDLLDRIEVPVLAHLELFLSDRGVNLESHLIDLINRPHSSCQLKTLHIHRPGFREDELIRILCEMPSLECLVIAADKLKFSDELVKLLQPPKRYLPSLTRFDFTGPISFQIDSMISMIKARLDLDSHGHACRKLDTFSVTCSNVSWGREQNMKALKTFYEVLRALEVAHGARLPFDYV